MDMDIRKMTKKDFKQVPKWKYFTRLGVEDINSIVIIPTKEKHNSGFMCMDFVAVDDNFKPMYRLSGCSDILNIDCSPEFRNYLNYLKGIPNTNNYPRQWKIDCLPCGYLRLFCNYKLKSDYCAVSSYNIVADTDRPWMKGK